MSPYFPLFPSVTVDGFTSTTTYGTGATDSSLATGLVTGFSASGSPVVASCNGAVLTLTAVATGSATNYPITISNGADFAVHDPNVALTNGTDPQTVYDAGTATVSIVNNAASPAVTYTANANWQSGSTVASVLGNLASAINSAAGSILTASVKTGYLNLLSTGTGSSTDYSVSISLNDTQTPVYPTLFPNPSFSMDATSMTGGNGADTTYGTLYSYQVPSGGYAGNGNILQHSDSVMGTWLFNYDTLNRLTTATAADNVPANYASMNGCWTYDAFGNRTLEAFSTATSTPCTQGAPMGAIYTSVTPTAKNQVTGFTYDAAGNVLSDGQNQYLYDAEGRLCAVETTITTPTFVQYLYDAEGRRVGKGTVPGLTCNAPTTANSFALTNQYLLGLSGEQVSELDGSGTWKHSNFWAAGGLLATYDGVGVHFSISDPLGTKRIQASAAGLVELTCRGLPFGNGISNLRATDCSGTDDGDQHHFTGKERDTESGNDYFEARYYASSMGRFMSPDWSAKEDPVPYAHLDDPQSLNLYAYVLNNPLAKADLDGHGCPPDCSTGNDVADFLGGAANAFASDNALGAGRMNQSSDSGQLGQAFGDFGAAAVGAGEFLLGTGGNLGGLALDATGVGAIVGVPANVVSTAAMVQGGAATGEGLGHLLFSKRTGDFTPAEKKEMDSKNAEANGGVNKCTNCGQEVQKVQNKAGEPTPSNQLQRHHDPPLSKRPSRIKSPKDRILCKDCHVQEHKNN